eukprot:COSAG05_NODE_177_length_14916_cov_8.104002_11_plen_125_part_00
MCGLRVYRLVPVQDGSEGLSPELLLSKAETKDKTKKVLQRISNDTFKQQGRTLGKLSHSNPLVVFERVISTVKQMPNIISALVDSLRYHPHHHHHTLLTLLAHMLRNNLDTTGIHYIRVRMMDP